MVFLSNTTSSFTYFRIRFSILARSYFYGPMPYSTGMLQLFRLEKFDKGFVFVVPRSSEPHVLPSFVPSMIHAAGQRTVVSGVQTVFYGDLLKLVLRHFFVKRLGHRGKSRRGGKRALAFRYGKMRDPALYLSGS